MCLTKAKTSITRQLSHEWGRLEFSKLNLFVAHERIHMLKGIKIPRVAIFAVAIERN